MKLNKKYLQTILKVFADSKTVHTTAKDLENADFDLNSDRLIHHFLIIQDQNLLVSDARPGEKMLQTGPFLQRTHSWSDFPFRLTAEGHRFLEESAKS